MKRKIFVALLVISIILMAFCSCKQEKGTASMKLLLKQTDLGAKTLMPGDAGLLQITRYSISGTGPDNAEFNVSTDSTSVTINGLEVGSWNVVAKGLNSAGTELIRGTTVYELSQNSGTAQIVLNQMVGNGTLELEIDWVNTEVPDANLTVYLQHQGDAEAQMSVTPDYANRRAVINTSLAAGSYIIRGVLKSGDFHVGGFVDSLRIVAGQVTSGEVSISQMQYADASGYFYLVNQSGVPVRGTISGFGLEGDNNVVSANVAKEITFTLDSSFEASPGLKIQWFLDGVSLGNSSVLGSTNKVSINVASGSHRIDAVVSNDLLGSYGSVTATFLSMLDGVTGTLSKLSEFSTIRIGSTGTSSDYLALGNDTIVSPLPSGRFLVVSPSKGKLVIMEVVRNYLDMVKVYSATDFPWISDINAVKSDSVLPWVVFGDDNGGTQNLTFMKFNQADGTLTQYPGSLGRITGTFAMNASLEMTLGNPAMIGFSGSRAAVYITDSSAQFQGMTSARLLWFNMADSGIVFGGTGTLDAAYANPTGIAISPSGNFIALTGANANTISFGMLSGTGGVRLWKNVGNTSSVPRTIVLGADNCLTVANGKIDNFTADYDSIASDYTVTPAVLDLSADLLIYNTQSSFLYGMDSLGRTVYSISRSASNDLVKIGSCSISLNSAVTLKSMALAGSHLLVSADNGYLTLCKVLD